MRSTESSPAGGRLDTQLFMTASAVYMGVLGVIGIFLPQELLSFFGGEPDPIVVVFVSIAGSLYFGFAVLNWMARRNVIGGIYSRPVAVANFAHFFAIAILLIKNVTAAGHAGVMAAGFVVNGLFAVYFGWLLFGKVDPRT